MWASVSYLVLLISTSTVSAKSTHLPVLDSRRFHEDFKGVDSDFDLEKAMTHFKIENFENITQKLPPIVDMSSKMKVTNYTSEEITKLLKMGESLIDNSLEKELEKVRKSIREGEQKVRHNITENKPTGKKRVKRQGKFQEASKVDNLKMLRIYLMMFKNLYANSNTGGAHPLHVDVPKPIIYLVKRRIMEFFFPPVGDEKKTANS